MLALAAPQLSTDTPPTSAEALGKREVTLATLTTYRAVTDELIEKHDGRVFGGAAGSVIAEFTSQVEAVRCGDEMDLATAAESEMGRVSRTHQRV